MNPYVVLGVSSDADDAEVRRAYLSLTAESPPERFPERFAGIRRAWEMLKTEEARARFKLFNADAGARTPMGVVAAYERDRTGRRPPAEDTLMELFRDSVRAGFRKES